MVDDTPAGSFGATESSWTLTTRTLALVLAQDVAGGQAVTVTMLSACELELPSHSLSATQASLQLSFDDADDVDDIALATFAQSPAVSAELTATSLSYSPGGAALSAVSPLTIALANSAAMLDGMAIACHPEYHQREGDAQAI